MTYPHLDPERRADLKPAQIAAWVEYAAWAERTLSPRNPTWSEWQAQIRRMPFRARAKRKTDAKEEAERPEQVDFFGRTA